jgi:hypothetical protein
MRRAYKGAVMYMRLVDPASLLMLISRQLCGCRQVGRAAHWGGLDCLGARQLRQVCA